MMSRKGSNIFFGIFKLRKTKEENKK